MYERYLGKKYHSRIRKLLKTSKGVVPNSMIDADYNIGAMQVIIAPSIERVQAEGLEFTEERYEVLKEAALHALAGILCIPLYSKSQKPQFTQPKYQKNWKKKQQEMMEKSRKYLKVLVEMG